jgi:DNA-binding response OmpR family regulator
VDDDKRVLELLEIAFGTQGFKVLTAGDGDEAVRSASQEKPDLIVLDVRLPRRSGLDVCEMLRRDLPDPGVPIVVVSAAVETETRLQAFARGADDFLAKPFSPKELVARVKRLLARTTEARQAKQRVIELERDLGRARHDLERANLETRREQRLHELASGPGQALHGSLDADEIVARLLFDAQNRLGSGFVALLWSERPGQPLRPWAARGETLDRVAALEVRTDGPLGTLLEGLGRPVLRRELDRFPELRAELPSFLAHAVTVLAPIPGPGRIEGLLVADERRDGGEPRPAELELLASLCAMAGASLANAARVREQLIHAITRLAETVAPRDEDLVRRRGEAGALLDHAAHALLLPPRYRLLMALALQLGSGAPQDPVREVLLSLRDDDATGLVRDLLMLEERSESPGAPGRDLLPEEWRPPLLLRVGRDFAAARADGDDREAALARASNAAGEALDPATARALRDALSETVHLAGQTA